EASAEARERVRALLAEAGSLAADEAAARIVIVDGRLDERLSRLDGASGLEIARIGPEESAGVRRGRAAPHPLALMNLAFASDGVAIRAESGVHIDKPLELFLVASGEGRVAQHPRIALALGRHARLDIVVHALDAADAEGWVNDVVDVVQDEGS